MWTCWCNPFSLLKAIVDMSPVNDLIVAAEVVEDESEPYGGIAECL
ncbi:MULTISPECIES: hypothetical protein [Clostridia]|uniref:Uncharacterized protein n=1 Tax=Enterocloster clostridioformis TaxID=1531 RepID=A0A7T9A6K2_9FIRM|nr:MULTISPECIES: hypothetical protein [Clostridia]MBS7002948.1 hypothetical protein [Enterocloster clostridioformis]MCF2702565.1 hypothetical protein [Enterocloster clostridioformis]MCI6124595.1 hypothetical protein [Enterocloster clostridioformis]MCI6140490.1 hypothetical protein [Clostridium sp.]MCI7609320.1 hypothetical protein [Enterocloster clostridioformis]